MVIDDEEGARNGQSPLELPPEVLPPPAAKSANGRGKERRLKGQPPTEAIRPPFPVHARLLIATFVYY